MSEMTEKVLAWICELEKQCFRDCWSLESLKETYKYDYNQFLVVYEKEDGFMCSKIDQYQSAICDLKGYLIANFLGEESELLRIAVETDSRKNGVAQLLMDYYGGLFKDCRKYFLEVRQSNTAARHLYEKSGYRILGNRKDYYTNPTEDAILYMRAIG